MNRNNLLLTALLICTILLSGCSAKKKVVSAKPKVKTETSRDIPVEPQGKIETEEIEELELDRDPDRLAPYVMREFRAAWIATVANINWPSKSGLTTQQQQREAIQLLDLLKKNNYNAVIFQARPQADALYKSDLEPWSFFLTGTVGKAPEPYYDPLEFWINAAHERGMELHVWLNPYRAHHSTGGPLSEKSLVKKHPDFVVGLKNGMWWMDPSKQATQDHSSAVVMDIVKRYNIDGIHFDDYFYPYASYNKGQDFPDAASYQEYLKSGGKLTKPDWRREEINLFVERIYKEIKAEKPEVKFGISPFGIWRPGFPKSIKGMDQYNELYADAKLWLNKGWIDYFMPQLYWKINQTAQSFPVLLGWWDEENTQKRHLWPGLNLDFGGDSQNIDETINQIMLTRGMLTDSKGNAHWSIAPLIKYPNLAKGILDGPYKNEALVPASPWLNSEIPKQPLVQARVVEDKLQIEWQHIHPEKVSNWIVYYRSGADWNYKILGAKENRLELPININEKESSQIQAIGVTAISKTGIESNFKEHIVTKMNLKAEF